MSTPILRISVRTPREMDPPVVGSNLDRAFRQAEEMSRDILVRRAKEQVQKRGLVVSGDLYRSITGQIEDYRGGRITSASSDDIAAYAFEYGTKPTKGGGPVNVAEILEWMEKRGIPGGVKAAFGIAVAIGRKGLPLKGRPKRIFSLAQQASKREIENLWRKIVANAVGE